MAMKPHAGLFAEWVTTSKLEGKGWPISKRTTWL